MVDAEVKGLVLRNTTIKDVICLKVVYVLEKEYNGCFIVLSEKNMQISQVMQFMGESIDITME